MGSSASSGAAIWRAAVAFLVMIEAARAAELSLRMSLRISEGYNDNVRLVSTSHPSVTISSVTPGVEVAARTETLTAIARAQATVNRYTRDTDLNATDFGVDASLTQLNERGEFAVRAEFVRDSTLASELNQTGIVQANRQRTRANLNPSWKADLNERENVRVGYDFADVSYKDAEGTGLVDYRTGTPYAIYSYRLSERSTVLASAGYLRLSRSTQAGTLSNLYVQSLLETELTELLKAKVGVGLNRIRSKAGVGHDTEEGWLAQASAERTLLSGMLTMGVARDVNAIGSGELTQTDRLFASWTERLSPRLSYSFAGTLYRNEPTTSAAAADTYYRVGANLTYLLSEEWAFEADIAHASQRPDQGDSAQASSIFLSTRYTLPTHRYSF